MTQQAYAAPTASAIARLAAKAAHWAFWTSIVRQLLAIGTTMVVSRLVTPSEFGIAAMAITFMALLVLFDTALTWATVQSPSLDQRKLDTLFWTTASVGSSLWFLAYMAGPLLAEFYGQKELSSVCAVLGFAVFLNSLTTQPAALLKRQLKQKTTNVIDTVALAVSSLFSILLALDGRGYWAIIGQIVSMQGVRALLLLVSSGYRPRLPLKGDSIRPELRKALGFAASNYVCYFQLYLGGILTGHTFGAVALGHYQRAYNAKSLPTSYATMVVTDVMVSSLAALRHDRAAMEAMYHRALRASIFIACPAGAILFPMAPEVVRALYGTQWAAAVPLLQMFSVAALALPVSTSTIWLFLAAGRAREQLKMNALLSMLAVFVLIPIANVGSVSVLVAAESLLFAGPYLLLNVYFSHRATGLRVSATLRVIAPVLGCSVAAAAAAWGAGELLSASNWLIKFLAKLLVAAATYLALAAIVLRPLPSYFSFRKTP